MKNKKETKKDFTKINEFLEVCSKTGEVRMIGSHKVLEGMKYLPEQGVIKEYRYRPLEDGEDLEDYLSEQEDTETVCIVDLGNGLEVWDGKEYWAVIDGYEGKYSVSTFGRVRNNIRDKILSQSERYKGGYLRVNLYDSKGKIKTVNVHRLVAKAFLPNPQNLPQVNHRDEVRTNNRVDNLEFCSAQYNIEYSKAKEVAQLDLKTGEVIETFRSCNEAERQTGINAGNIAAVCNGKCRSFKGYGWRYTGNGCTKTNPKLGRKRSQVEVFDRDTGKVVGTFKNCAKTAEYLGVSNVAVSRCCNGIINSVKGYGCRFKD